MKCATAILLVGCCAACSSSKSGPQCEIEGSYTATATPMAGNTCPTGSVAAVTDTLTARPPGASGPDFALQITGAQGSCPMNFVAGESCKLQGKCDIHITDALDPSNAIGTAQYSWTFDENGFTGTSTIVIPPGKSLPDGCSGQATTIGKRQ